MRKSKLLISLILFILISSLAATNSGDSDNQREGAFQVSAYKLRSSTAPLTPVLEITSDFETLQHGHLVELSQTDLQKLIGTRSDLTDLDTAQHIVFSYRVSGNQSHNLTVKVAFGGNVLDKTVKKFTRVDRNADKNITTVYPNETVEFSYTLVFTEYSFNKEASKADTSKLSWPPVETIANSSGVSTGSSDMTASITFGTPNLLAEVNQNLAKHTWVARGVFGMTIDEDSFNAAPAGTYVLPIVVTLEVD